MCTVKKKKTNGGQRNCLKHVEFHSKNKSEKLVHLVGFIVRNYCILYLVNCTCPLGLLSIVKSPLKVCLWSSFCEAHGNLR